MDLADLRATIERIKADRTVSVLNVGEHAKDYLIAYGRAARWIDEANGVNPRHRLLGFDVVLDPAMDPRRWRLVAQQSGEVLGEGVIPVTLEDGERIGGARLNDDGTVTCYIANEKIWHDISSVGPNDFSLSLGPHPAHHDRDYRQIAEDMATGRVVKPIIITGI